MNKDKLISMCHNVSSETGLSFNSVLTYFFLENILKKLSESNYSQHIIFKGGFVLSNIVGIESRSTVDIDISAKNMFKDKETTLNTLQNILKEVESDIQFVESKIKEVHEAMDAIASEMDFLVELKEKE